MQRRRRLTTVATGRFLRLVRQGHWEFAQRLGASGVVAVLARTAQRELVLVEQHRVPVGRIVVDLPAGLVGDGHAGERASTAARRELEEETGYRATRWRELARVATTPGLSDEIVTVLTASGLRRVGDGGGVEGEGISVRLVPLARVRSWLARRSRAGALIDQKVYTGLWLSGWG